MQVSDYI